MPEKKVININDIINQNQEDYFVTISKENFETILEETEKLVNFESQTYPFVFIGNDFLNTFINIYNMSNLKQLLLIKKIIHTLHKVDDELDLDYKDFNKKIHNTAIEMIKKGELKNVELLNFIENEDIFFTDENIYEDINYRPLEIFDGFDLSNDNDEFYKKWNEVKVFEKYRFDDDFYIGERIMINKINHIKDFGKLLKLFNFENETNLCNLISDKYKKLLPTYIGNICPNFLKDSSLLIYILGKNSLEKNFLENTIKIDIKSPELIKNIFVFLISNYKDISQDTTNFIANYFLANILSKNKIFINGSIIYFLLNNRWDQIIECFKKYYIIKEEELFNEEKDNINFTLLEVIKKDNLFEKYPFLRNTYYSKNITLLSNKILNDIMTGDIQYNIIEPIFKNPEKQLNFREKLNNLLFLNSSNINLCMEKIENNIRNIYDNIDYLTKLDEVLNFFYEENYKDYIISIKNLKNEIINGMLKTINIKKDSIVQLKKIIPEFEKIYQLKSSGIFLKLFHNNKFNKLIRNHKGNLLNESKENFDQFRYIFKEDWIKSLDKKYLNIIFFS